MIRRLSPTFVLVLAFSLLLALVLSGCASEAETSGGDTSPADELAKETAEASAAPTPEEGSVYTPQYQPTGNETAVIKTNKGDITIVLYGKDAPVHVGNFVELARKGFYDDTKFHRFVQGFVVQGGDPQTAKLTPEQVRKIIADQTTGQFDPSAPALGTGGPGYTIKAEFDPSVNPNKHEVGALGMARSQMPDSAGSQFYFALEPLPQLDGQYTVFGKVTQGMDVVRQLGIGDVIESIEISGASE